ncbi:HAMP domain-containing sensor histidine kinase [Zoogloea sp.]|uniref:HAMP domain-containing sensor histidine kinase n=1 Tax=Zoogloea sp. TaxID=49181 RepID=UPI0035B32D98
MKDCPTTPPAAPAAVDLKRHLLLRVSLFALAVGVVATVVVLHQTRARIRDHLARTGVTVERLIAGEADQLRDAFRRSLDGLALTSLDGIGPLLGICVAVEDLYKRPVVSRCFHDDGEAPTPVRWLLARLIGPEVAYRGVIGQYPGVKVGEFVVTPDLDSEGRAAWVQIRTVLGMSLAILLLNLLIYRPVRRALRPADQILAVLGRMEAGDLSARMPRPRLIELRRIAAGFDHLAAQLQKTLAAQRQLAQRLLAVREEERRRLARELHDEFGQCLASVGAEAAFIAARAESTDPSLLPAARAVSAVTGHMMESLQGILHQLRPVGLEEFGLTAALEQLVAGWRRRMPGCDFALTVTGAVDGLPDGLTVSLYRIVQESLTNALRHGTPGRVAVDLARDAAGCRLRVEDDGEGDAPPSPGSGLGVLGMCERVEALGGQFALEPLAPRGMRVRVDFSPEALQATEPTHD